MIKKLLSIMTIMLTAITAYADGAGNITGAWRGELGLGQMKLPLIFNFKQTPGGDSACTIDSPSQGAKDIPAEIQVMTPDSISVNCALIGASYSGTISGNKITGSFRQRGYSFPLVLEPEAPVEDRRPQTPKPPFPYQTTDTTFTTLDGSVMSGTLTMPLNADSKKMPVVLLITGSGPQNRDEELFDHKPFAVIADYLARNGIASLRYDDRGTGKSTGNYATATTQTFKDDAAAGISLLRGIDNFDKVGVIGHSEGGTIAFMLGADKKCDYIISLAGMAVSGKKTMLRQNKDALDKTGLSDADKQKTMQLIGKIMDNVEQQNKVGISTPVDVDSLAASLGITPDPMLMQSLKASQKARTPWSDAFVSLQPGDYLKDVKCPLLAINGELDKQVYADNLDVIHRLVPQARIMLMPGLNHLMQHARTGDISEYNDIKETIAPEVLDAIVSFIKSL